MTSGDGLRIAHLGPDASAADIRALAPPRRDVGETVSAILAEVRDGGDASLVRLTARLDDVEIAPSALRASEEELDAALAGLDPALGSAIVTAIENVGAVARAQLAPPTELDLPDGQRVEVVDLPVKRAGAYVPGGRAPYASSVVMCAVTARTSGVEKMAVCTPPSADGRVHPTVLAACRLCGVDEVYAVGGAQAIAALAFGTESVRAVDVIVGPGNAWVAEAKRQVFGVVGIDSVAGPSELAVLASEGADPELLALDLLAQAEHGADSLLALVAPEETIAAVEEAVATRAAARGHGAALALVRCDDPRAGLRLVNDLAPEHLQIAGPEAEALAGEVRTAGCLFVGRDAATAFGDYVAGTNHVLPTGGAARFAGALSPATFRRRMARVTLPPGAAARLAPAGAALAAAEGFPVHGESMLRRAGSAS